MNGVFRTGLFYALVFLANGVNLPFIALWLREKGISGAEISIVLAAPMLARLLTGPLLAVWGDSFRMRRTPIAILCLVAAVAIGAMGLAKGLALWLPLWFVGATAFGSVIPLTDVLTLRAARRQGFVFAVARSAGSVAFIAASVAMGWMLTFSPGDIVIVAISLTCLFAAAAALFVLPEEFVHEGGETLLASDRFRGLGQLLGDRWFMVAIGSVGLIQAAHAFSYGFSTLVWRAQGLSEGVIGMLWALGVVAEIAFMWLMEPWRRKWGPWSMLMLGGAAAVLRWTAMAFLPPLWLLWPLQLLHALTFAATFLAGLQLVERLSPPQSLSVANTLSSALSSGVLLGLATALSGPLYDEYGAGGYAAMAVLAALGMAAAFSGRKALREPSAPESRRERPEDRAFVDQAVGAVPFEQQRTIQIDPVGVLRQEGGRGHRQGGGHHAADHDAKAQRAGLGL
jgi:PPP family 3-phenylpropionic acid transporter